MRYLKDIPHQQLKIGLYQWNNKYIIKIESGLYEQTYKIDDYEVESADEIEKCMDEAFIRAVMQRFDEMHGDFFGSLQRNHVLF
ncbi:hypothetical protein [Dyadobacter sandarakinus]|uniref:Uncharacterized protein n=1 Tax=Dyadobacter sandarakinus TaxID=2747268 RepID=A0ABX7I4E8_9BACT|nr:hypothetical protein [Dyadobacter sandarakinus]QRR00442.1 hypothetical protein HWI92_05740 [Dyadobacter sandarakinus]